MDGLYFSTFPSGRRSISTNPFISLFGRSPIGPIQQHIVEAHEYTVDLLPFFHVVITENWAQVEQVQQDMVRPKQEVDRLKKNVRMHLPKSLFLPVPCSDLLELLSVQNKVVNRAKDAAGLMLGRCIHIPLPLQGQMLAYVQRSVGAGAQAPRVVNESNELFEVGFGGRKTSLVEGVMEEPEAIENDTDRIRVEVRRELFRLESELPPVDVMFLYQIIEWTGDVTDRAQRVGNRLGQLPARQAPGFLPPSAHIWIPAHVLDRRPRLRLPRTRLSARFLRDLGRRRQ